MLPFTLYDLNMEYLEKERIAVQEQLFPVPTSTEYANWLEGTFYPKHTSLRVISGITCCCSMLGAMVIILTYYFIHDIQTKSRLILVHLSFADFGVAFSNFIGVTVYFDQYLRFCPTETYNITLEGGSSSAVLNYSPNSTFSCRALRGLCKTQAFFAGFSTLSSVLWTLSLAVYIYCLVVHTSRRVHHKILYAAYVLCWGLPLLISSWLISTDRLGYSSYGGSGWCTLKINDSLGKQDTFAVVFGNDLWIYLTFVMVTIFYLTTHCYIKFQLKESNPSLLQGSNLETVSKADTKFILIPFLFLLLRIWTMILVVLMVYAHAHPPHFFSVILIYGAGIGDSGQGAVNALLFCVFTPRVRQPFLRLCCLKWRYLKKYNPQAQSMPVLNSKLRSCVSPLSDKSCVQESLEYSMAHK